jgi:hypothetical protein
MVSNKRWRNVYIFSVLMDKFLLKSTLIIVPFVLIIIGTVLINPYDYPYWIEVKSFSEFKETKSFTKDSRLYACVDALNIEESTVFIGDSRTHQLFNNNVSDTMSFVCNMAVGGLCFNEIIDLSWHIVDNNPHISNLYIGLNFNHFGEKNKLPLMTDVVKSASSPLNFILNKHNVISSFDILFGPTDSTDNSVNNSLMLETFKNEDVFWNYQIESAARNFYENMRPNPRFRVELDSLIKTCKQLDINIGFFSPPTHVQLQEQPERWAVSSLEDDFLEILSSLPVMYLNLDFVNNFTKDKSNFKDPFHLAKNHEKVLLEIMYRLKRNPTYNSADEF